jgi:hypothetical protein
MSRDISKPIPLGNNTYELTREATNVLSRDIDAMKTEVTEDAANFCATQGKQLKVVSLTSEKPLMTFGYCKAKIVFKALNAGDPELTGAPAPVAGNAQPAYIAVSQPPPPAAVRLPLMTTSEIVAALTQLDDLRKKGILTEEEFQSEKQKVLSHSQ